MSYDIITYGDPVLRQKASPVEEIDDGIRQLSQDMLEAMYAKNGLGLAAEQIGRTEAISVIDVKQEDDAAHDNPNIPMPLVVINPTIIEMSGEETGQEGCLSFPEIYVSIKRAAEVTFTFLDLDGNEQTLKVKGLLARVVQHEVDHLNGFLLVDRMSAVQKVAVAGKLKRLKKANY
ncbi:peptide deformylase [Verrucomicrobiota bacterium]